MLARRLCQNPDDNVPTPLLAPIVTLSDHRAIQVEHSPHSHETQMRGLAGLERVPLGMNRFGSI
jgi:hypothetical protein